jgi:hypothetical protein
LTIWSRWKDLFEHMTIFLAYRKDGSVKAVLSHGKEQEARETTEIDYYERWTLDEPRAGPTRIWLKAPPEGV